MLCQSFRLRHVLYFGVGCVLNSELCWRFLFVFMRTVLGDFILKIKIAIVATLFFQDFLEKIIKNFELNCDFEIFTYSSLYDLPSLFLTIPEEFQAVLTSGVFPEQILRRSFPRDKRIIYSYYSDSVEFYHLLLKLLDENRALDFSRVYADVNDIVGEGLFSYLMNRLNEQLHIHQVNVYNVLNRLSLKQLMGAEAFFIEKHMRLWRENKIDYSITRFSSIFLKLKEVGLPVHFPLPSKNHIYEVFQKTIQDIRIVHFKENLSAVAYLTVDPQKNTASTEGKYETLKCALSDFYKDYATDYVLQEQHCSLEIFINQKTLREQTQEFQVCRLSLFLKERLQFQTYIGYGIGENIYQARFNAINANREAALSSLGRSYLVNQHDEIIGPIGQEGCIVVSNTITQELKDMAQRSNLSPLTVQRVLACVKAMQNEQITPHELALKLSITPRSANRFLSSLKQGDVLEITEKKKNISRGRPTVVYGIKRHTSQA